MLAHLGFAAVTPEKSDAESEPSQQFQGNCARKSALASAIVAWVRYEWTKLPGGLLQVNLRYSIRLPGAILSNR